MKDFILGLWRDEARFRAAARGLLAFLGFMVQQGVVPTFVDGAGKWLGPMLIAAALFVTSRKAPPPLAVGQRGFAHTDCTPDLP